MAVPPVFKAAFLSWDLSGQLESPGWVGGEGVETTWEETFV